MNLVKPDPGVLLLSPNVQEDVLKALNALSIFLGCRDRFRVFKDSLGLKWSRRDPKAIVIRILNGGISPSEIWSWIERVKGLGWKYYFPVAMAFLTGLRAGEVFTMLDVVERYGLEGYYNPGNKVLEHFRFDKLFLRGKKNAFISFISENAVRVLGEFREEVSYDCFRSRLRRASVESKLQDVRRFFATTLRNRGIQGEIVDLLQGRVSASVFLEYYYRPDIEEVRERVLEVLKPWEEKLLS